MLSLPKVAEPLFNRFSIAFSRPTHQRFILLAVAAILATGRRTITAMLWTVRSVAHGHFSSYHRVFSRSNWLLRVVARVLSDMVMELVARDKPVIISVDDTTARHKGPKVYGKGCHYDAVRSSHAHVAWKWGHRWVVLAIHVKFPFARRPWALPVLCALYRPEKLDQKEGHGHRTPVDLAIGLTRQLMHWHPERKFVLLGDGGYASHELARFAHHHRRRLTLVSRFHADANLYAPPPRRRKGQCGRPRLKGRKLASPGWTVARARRTRARVQWYGGTHRRIELVSRESHWYKGGGGLIPLRWVFVHDRQGTRRDEYFYSTDPQMTPQEIVTLYTARWSIEVTFQEMREHLGFETTKQHCRKSVLRMGPCLLGCYTLVALIYAKLVEDRKPVVYNTRSYQKAEPAFSDALYAIRRLLWPEILKQAMPADVVSKLPDEARDFLLNQLAAAA